MTTVHVDSPSPAIVDAPPGTPGEAARVPRTRAHVDRGGRCDGQGVAEYRGRFDGVAVRAPVPVGSLADIVALAARPTSVEEVNRVFTEEAEVTLSRNPRCDDGSPVSSDIIKDTRASVVDLGMSQVVDGDLVKVMRAGTTTSGGCELLVREASRIATEMGRQGAPIRPRSGDQHLHPDRQLPGQAQTHRVML